MSGEITIKIDTYDFKKKVDNFLGHEFVEFFRDPGDDAMLKIHQFLAELFDPYVPINLDLDSEHIDTAGNLRENIDVSADGITYNAEYAHYMYVGDVYGPNFFVPITQTVNEVGDLVWDKTGPWGWRSKKDEKKHPTGRPFNYTTPTATSYWDIAAMMDNEELVKKTIRDIIIEAWNNEH